MEGKQNTCSVIARLMGLDELPPQKPSYRQQKVLSDDYLRKTASIGLLEKSSLHKDHVYRITAEEQNGIMHVFDSKIRKSDKQSARSISGAKPNPSRVRAQFNFGKQKNACAKMHQSIDKKLYHAAKPIDVLEDLHVTGDNSLRHFNYSNISTKQLHDPKALQLHLRYSRTTAPIITKLCKQSGKALTDRTVLSSIKKLEDEFGESDVLYPNKLLKTDSELKDKASNFSTRTVVLKPNSIKAQNYAAKELLFRPDVLCQSDDPEHRKYGELLKPESWELNNKLTETEKTTSDVEPSGHSSSDPRRVGKKAAQEEWKNIGSSRRGASRSRITLTVENSSLNFPEALMTSSRDSFLWNKRERISNPFPSGLLFAREAKKQIFERWKTAKSFEEVEVSVSRCTLGQTFAMHYGKARPKSMFSKSERNCFSSGLCFQRENSELGSSDLFSKVGSINEHIRKFPRPKLPKYSSTASVTINLKPMNEAFQTRSSGQEVTGNHHKLNGITFSKEDSLESRDAGVNCENQYFPGEHLEDSHNLHYKLSGFNVLRSGSDDNLPLQVNQGFQDDMEKDIYKEADDHASSDVWDNLTQQKSSHDSPDGELIHRCALNDPELAINLKVINQPSPDSVLEPPFKEENHSASEFFDSTVSDLSGLAMKLQFPDPNSTERNSEGSEMAVSSDEDTEKEAVDFSRDKENLWGALRPEESRDFSYLIDVLDEANSCGWFPDMGYELWLDKESAINPSVFEALEKKYGKQTSWQKSERRLLFDRISSGLCEILGSSMDFRTSVKPLRRRFSATLRRDDIEEELWMLLTSQEKEVAKDLSDKVLGREIRWLELEDDIIIICRELVDILFDELAAEVCGIESI